ncbi:hypothetical protein [Flavobacterium silvaticum]|uniref:HMA domain-containing protein n=1 Tax=Flavobacterium silvaticum TaxID=1852020 RepID=A0A972JG39_9FLAO|nr:hypothetical protein [Flavobacterium silvaticum]NMH27806.1 hypothetical protein [Flavobacterium silvaticum]
MIAEPLIFKTDIDHICQDCGIAKALNTHAGITKWTIDLEDKDKVLCVFPLDVKMADVVMLLARFGHSCEELN